MGRTKPAGPPVKSREVVMGAPIERERESESANTRTGFFSCGRRWPMRALFRRRPRIEADPPAAVLPAIVGVKKSAVYSDGDGQFRIIEFFLPADLLTKLRRPINHLRRDKGD